MLSSVTCIDFETIFAIPNSVCIGMQACMYVIKVDISAIGDEVGCIQNVLKSPAR